MRVSALLGSAMAALLVVPLLGLVARTGAGTILEAMTRPEVRGALLLSLRTTGLAMLVVALLGTPLARWLAGARRTGWTVVVELPVVLPPAVMGVALLETFGRRGWLGPFLYAWGVELPFSTAAVVVAQVVVAAPLYVLTATAAFRSIDDDLVLVARTLGASPARVWWKVMIPAALPGLLTGLGLAWARALGEFGATLLFAGSLPGRTRTLPLAIYDALERDLDEARALAVILLALAAVSLLGLRFVGWRGARVT